MYSLDRGRLDFLYTEILRVLAETNGPLSHKEILKLLKNRGINTTETTIRNRIEKMREMGYVVKVNTKINITEEGLRILNQATIFERLEEFKDFVEYSMFKSTFDLYNMTGTVPTNVMIIDKNKIDTCLEIMKSVADANLVTSRHIALVEEGGELGTITIPEGKVGIGTISSTIYNVIMLGCGVVLGSEFAGLIYYENHRPVGICEMINYSGTTISPGLLLIKGGYTSVHKVAENGNGYAIAAIKSFNGFAYEVVEREIMLADARGIKGVLTISLPMDNRLNLPTYKKALLIVLAGMNYIAPIHEKGLNPEFRINEVLVDFERFKDIDKFL